MKKKELTDLKRIFENKGLKFTSQRRNILEIFKNNSKHLSASDIYLLAKNKKLNIGLATIYRTLELLEELGLIVKRSFPSDYYQYEFVYGKKNHHHLICKKCGRIIEVKDLLTDSLYQKIIRENKFNGEECSLKIYGYCDNCKNNS